MGKIAYNSAYIQIVINVQLYLRTASHYCVWLSSCQLPRNRYAERLILRYKPNSRLFIANNVGLYINSHQAVHRLRPLTFHWTSTTISRGSAQSVSCNKLAPSKKSPSVEIVIPDCTMYCIIVNVKVSPWRLYYTVAKAYSLLGGYRTTIKSPPADLFSSRNFPQGDFQTGDIISWHPACLAVMDEYGTICA